MDRDSGFYLLELQKSCDYLLQRTANETRESYFANQDLRFIVERNFSIIGELMVQLRRTYPRVAQHFDEVVKIIGFRNLLIHQYWDIDQEQVWSIVNTKIQPLRDQAVALLNKTPEL